MGKYDYAAGGKSLNRGCGAYSEEKFTESKVTGLSRDAYNPGDKPNVYVSNAKGTNRIDLSGQIDRKTDTGVTGDWYDIPGSSGVVSRNKRGFKWS